MNGNKFAESVCSFKIIWSLDFTDSKEVQLLGHV